MSEYGKAMIAYSDEAIWIIFVPILAYSNPTNVVMQVRAGGRSSQHSVTEFIFQAAVPKTFQLTLDPPSGTNLSQGSVVTQKITIANPSKAVLKMRLKVSYSLNGVSQEKIQEIHNFPSDFVSS